MNEQLGIYNVSPFYLQGLKDSKKDEKEKEQNILSNISKINNNYGLNNNNMELYHKYVYGVKESKKYFNYYQPFINKNVPVATLLNENLTTVEGLDKKYDIEDGYILPE
jgi:hypothetical protein